MFRKLSLTIISCLILAGVAFAADSTKTEMTKPDSTMKATVPATADMKGNETMEPQWVKTKSGLRYRDIVIGVGEDAKITDKVESHYTLWLADGDKQGKKLQSSKDDGNTFPFSIGQPGLIKGWNEGMIGMKPGGVRQLIIPPDIGYGAKGREPLVPGNATLFFEIELVKNISQVAQPKKK